MAASLPLAVTVVATVGSARCPELAEDPASKIVLQQELRPISPSNRA
jgi:hypothetical protein